MTELPEEFVPYLTANLDNLKTKFYRVGMTEEGVGGMLTLIERVFLDGFIKGKEGMGDGGPDGTADPIVRH